MELTGKRPEGTFGSDVNVLRLVLGGDYMDVFTDKDHQAEHLKQNE